MPSGNMSLRNNQLRRRSLATEARSAIQQAPSLIRTPIALSIATLILLGCAGAKPGAVDAPILSHDIRRFDPATYFDVTDLPQAVVNLRRFLDEPYRRRLSAALSTGEFRYLAVMGYGTTSPCAPDGLGDCQEYLLIAGISDYLESPEHFYLNDHASLCACLYNQELTSTLLDQGR